MQLSFILHSSMHHIGESNKKFVVVTQQCGTHAYKYMKVSKTTTHGHYFGC